MPKPKPIGRVVSLKESPSGLEIKYTLVTEVPMTPNFIKVGGVMRPLKEFSDAQLRKIGREWTANLIAKAHKRKSNHEKS